MSNLLLAPRSARAENDPVLPFIQPRRASALLVALILCALSQAPAQNRDRDTRAIPATSTAAPPPEMRVDINHASLDELLKVPGITRTWGLRIVRFRPYRTKQDLLEQGIVTQEVYSRIKDLVIAHRDSQ